MIAVISDVHGNYEALRQVLKSIDENNISEIYCLGDVAGYYSQINQCCDELRRRNVQCIMGNHDWYMVGPGYCQRSKSVNDCIEYQRKIISSENLNWLSTFPLFRTVDEISMVHGGWGNPIDEYFEASKEYFDVLEGRLFMSGHSHIQSVADFGKKKYCNPGSVGQPRDNDPRSAYATWDGQNFQLHRVAYDYKIVGKLMEEAGFNGHYYGCLRIGAPKLGYHLE